MAYYLGYKKDGIFHPIDLNINNANDILSIVNFTCAFENEDQLIEYLYDEGLIQEENVELSYLIQKGKRDEKNYSELPNIRRIFYYNSSSAFDVEKLKKYIEINTKDNALIKYILSNLLKKYGLDEHLKNFLTEDIESSSRRAYLISVLTTILNNSRIISLNYRIESLINSIRDNRPLLEVEINSFIELALADSDTIIYLFRVLKKHLKFPKILEIEDLLKLEFEINGYHLGELEIKARINRFINHYIIRNQSVNSRNLVDLGSMIQDYKDYVLSLELDNYRPITGHDEEYNELDEFLEEDDFARCDTTSENVGIKLRPTDSSTWRIGN